MKAVLLQLGNNMWCEYLPEDMRGKIDLGRREPDVRMRTNETYWLEATARMAAKGLDTLLIDVGEALAYPSHPELAIEGSWSPDRMRAEVARLKAMGIEAIPKVNFSATHDGWLKDYHRMLGTPVYYQVMRDVIRDVAEAFGRPRFIHLGFDEECVGHMGEKNYFAIRQGELWWHDFLYAVKCTEETGSRAWIWSDVIWSHKDEFLKRMPKSVLQSNWYYDETAGGFEVSNYTAKSGKQRLEAFYWLDKAGYEQVPCGTNWVGWVRKRNNMGADDVMAKLVAVCRRDLDPKLLKGFLMAPWAALDTPENQAKNLRGIDLFADALAGRGPTT